jgi:hypothetical protein
LIKKRAVFLKINKSFRMKKQFNREIDSQPLLCEELRTDCVLVAKRSNVNNYLTIVAVILFAEKKLNGILC